jgi:hypothetical protein
LKLAGFIPPNYGVSIDHRDLVLDKTAHLSLTAAWNDGTKAAIDDYKCVWRFTPPLPSAPPEDCSIEVKADPAMFADGQSDKVTSNVEVEISRPGKKPIAVKSDTYSLVFYNLTAPTIVVEPQTMELDQSAKARIEFRSGKKPSAFTCSWSPRDLFQPSNACDSVMSAPKDLGRYPSGEIPVKVNVIVDKMPIESEPFSVSLRLPPARFYDFILDSTANMATAFDGITLMDHEKRYITQEINRFGPNGGWLAITAFGHDVPGAKDDCERFGSPYPAAPMNVANGVQAVSGLQIVGKLAPLAAAIDEAVKQYASLRSRIGDIKSYVILITASTNGCKNMSIEDAVLEMQSAFEHNDIQMYYKNVFSAVVAISPPGAPRPTESFLNSKEYTNEENQTILFIVQPGEQAADVIKALADLSDASNGVRRRACEQLRNVLLKEGDKKGDAILHKRCAF